MIEQARSAAKPILRWYASPTGVAFGLGLALTAIAVLVDGAAELLVLPGLGLIALAVPRRFIRDRARVDALMEAQKATKRNLRDAVRGQRQALETVDVRVGHVETRIRNHVRDTDDRTDGLQASMTVLGEDLRAAISALGESVADRHEKAGAGLEALRLQVVDAAARLDRSSGWSSEIHNRDLTDELSREIVEYWGPRLGLELAPQQLQAEAHRVKSLEARALGRIATNIEDVLVRSLAARTAARSTTEICEIGTLFGIGGLAVREAAAIWSELATLTVIDPLAGYYGPDRLDPPTGLPVTRDIFDRNVAQCCLGDGEVRLLEGYSTDDDILASASDREYDLLIIDGDHSYDGVRLDFERYAGLVRAGGILIVDDYGASAWPEVTRYTDEAIMSDPRFEFLGASYRTALFRRLT